MPTLVVVTRAGQEIVIEADAGLSVMENIRNAGIDEMMALCGGGCSCATCHVYVVADWREATGAATSEERDLLEDSAHLTELSRLSCQIEMSERLSGLRVRIAPED